MKKIAFIIIATFLGGLIQPAIAGHHKMQKLSVDMASIRAPIPGHSMTAAFLVINNAGKESCKLISAGSTFAEKIEFHTHHPLRTNISNLYFLLNSLLNPIHIL